MLNEHVPNLVPKGRIYEDVIPLLSRQNVLTKICIHEMSSIMDQNGLDSVANVFKSIGKTYDQMFLNMCQALQMSELSLLVERRRLGVGETNDDRVLAELVTFWYFC